MKVTVRDLTEKAEVIAGRPGLGREIKSPQVAEPSLSAPLSRRGLASRVVHLTPAQSAHLSSLSRAEQVPLIRDLLRQRPACILVSGGRLNEELLAKAESAKIPVLKSGNLSGLSKALIEKLTPRVSMHGVLVQVFGLGTLLVGESAIGKSEAALDLVLRGHKLVADDLVVLDKMDDAIIGKAADMGADLLNIRGLGVIDVRSLYGPSATAVSCMVGLIVELEEWKKGHYYSLLGLREQRHKILGVNIPYLKLPVKPGRTMATLVEVAARNQILKNRGVFTARDLNRRLKKRMTG
ncbi:MAG TPA: HPr(Ser) kinase/phosphatase [Nitrospirota bacterium]|nr:HPr(Ser) kinase/phosphatase [Nitrospirota bacterium]